MSGVKCSKCNEQVMEAVYVYPDIICEDCFVPYCGDCLVPIDKCAHKQSRSHGQPCLQVTGLSAPSTKKEKDKENVNDR